MRKNEFFGEPLENKGCSITNHCVDYFKQERDWTCSIACIRSLISCYPNHNFSEDDIIKMENLKMAGQHIEDIIKWNCLKGTKFVSSIEKPLKNTNDLYNLLLNGYAAMCMSSYIGWHYIVVVGYLTTHSKKTIDRQMVLIYEPYYNEFQLMRVEVFESMWYNKETGKEFEYIAIDQSV